MLISNGKCKLADFGTAVAAQKGMKELAGTMTYMAPEVFAEQQYSVLCDVWSIGVLLIELLGVTPPVMQQPHMASCHADAELWDGLEALLDTEPADFLRRCLRIERWPVERLLRHPFVADVRERALALPAHALAPRLAGRPPPRPRPRPRGPPPRPRRPPSAPWPSQ